MKRHLLLAALWSSIAGAGDQVSLVFERVPLMELARIAYSEIEKAPFILSPAALESSEVVSLSLRGVDRKRAVSEVDALIEGAGLVVARRNGVVWVGKAKSDEESEFLYRPRYRSATYLADLLAPLFKPGAFGQQRNIQSGLTQMPIQAMKSPAGKNQAIPAQGPPVDSGTSAYSLIDKSPDVLLFKGTEREQARLKSILSTLDVPTPELLVKAVVFEVSTENREQSALSLALTLAGGKLGLTLGKAVAGEFSAVFRSTGGIEVVASALSSDRRFRVVSSPTLRVRSGSTARLTVGAETPVLAEAQMDRNGNPVQSVEYRPSGVILDLKPNVREDVADLQINQQISNFIPTTTGVNGSPTLIKRELSTSVGISSEDILVLGGLDEEKSNEGGSWLSFLPRLFGASVSERGRSEVLLIMQAQRI